MDVTFVRYSAGGNFGRCQRPFIRQRLVKPELTPDINGEYIKISDVEAPGRQGAQAQVYPVNPSFRSAARRQTAADKM